MAEARQERIVGIRSPLRGDIWKALGIGLGLGACAGLLSLLFKGLILPLGLAAVLATGLALGWFMSKPLRIVRLLFIFLPFHVMFMVIAFGLLGLPEGVVRALASWKEGVLVFFVVAILFGIVLSGKKDFPLAPSDLFACLFSFQIVLYAFIAPLLGSRIPLVGRLYDVRDSLMLIVCYFLGRAFSLGIAELERLLKLILTVGAVTVVLGLLEWLFLPYQFFVLLGVSSYFKDFIGVNYSDGDWTQGLPTNFWTYMGSLGYVRRSVSVFMSSQGYAITFLILLPIATYFLLDKRRGSLRMFAFQTLGLLSSITRATLVVCTLLFFTMAKLVGKSGWVKRGFLGVALLAIGALIFSEGVRTLVIETLTWQSASSVSHLGSWSGSVELIAERPWLGYGLSEAGQNSRRFGGHEAGEESTPLRIIGELGAVGFVFYLGFWVAYILEAYELGRLRPKGDALRGLSALAIAICIGFLLNSIAADLLSNQYNNFATGTLLGLIRSACKAAGASGAATAG
jgi:hypothetical protein